MRQSWRVLRGGLTRLCRCLRLLHQHAALPGVGRAERRQLLTKALDGGTGLAGLAENDLVLIGYLR